MDAALRARGPYSMRLSTRLGSDATRVVRVSCPPHRDPGGNQDPERHEDQRAGQ